MTKPWISDAKSRRSRKYQIVHDDLREYAALKKSRIESKIASHRKRSVEFRQTGEVIGLFPSGILAL